MHGKHLLAMACSGCLLAAMTPALAADVSQKSSDYAGDTNTQQTTQHQTSSDNGSDNGSGGDSNAAMTEYGQAAQDDTMTGAASATDKATAQSTQRQTHNAMQASQTTQTGRVVGKLVDESGDVQGYIIRTGDAGADRFVFVPPENVRAVAETSSQTSSMTQSQQTSDTNTSNAQTAQKQQLLQRMYQQLQKQAVQIHLLRKQLAQQQNNMGAHYNQAGNAQQNPLDQVAHVIVDQFGRVQAIVLDSGVVLASPQQSSGGAQRSLADTTPRAAAGTNGNGLNAGNAQQRRQAIIIFKPKR